MDGLWGDGWVREEVSRAKGIVGWMEGERKREGLKKKRVQL